MRHPHHSPDRPSTRVLTILAGTYTVAAGLHGVLAVLARMWWPGVLAVVLAGVAIVFVVVVWRRHRETGGVVVLDARRTTAQEEPALRAVRRRDTDPTRA